MTDKALPDGWVVEVSIPSEPEERNAGTPWRPPSMPGSGPPSFEYFNVAIAAPDKAVEATTKYRGVEAKVGAMSVARKLSSAEIAVLSLKVGEVKPA